MPSPICPIHQSMMGFWDPVDEEEDTTPADAADVMDIPTDFGKSLMMKVVDPATAPERPKSFNSRPAYVDLEAHGLTMLPPAAGVFLSCHVSSCQWHGAYPDVLNIGKHMHHAPKWGEGLRTEREALILALKFVWTIYRTRTGNGSDHLAKLEDAMKMA